jgi:Fe-S cluster biogenesis protein NfuA
MNIQEQIQKVLEEKVNPVLAEHYGGATLTEYTDGVAWVKMTGACGGCPSAQETIANIVRTAVQQEVPEVSDVRLDNSVSDDLLDMARKILNKEI